jgi:TonB family protein
VDAAGGSDAAAAERSLADQIGELIEERKVYPESARRRGLEGDVVFQLKIYPDGRLRSLSLVESPRGPLLSRAAERLVRSIFPLRSPQQWDSHSCRVAVRYRLN